MKTVENRKKHILLIVILFGFALYTQVIWGIVASETTSVNREPIQSFLRYFPPFLRRIEFITYLTLACSITTSILISKWIKKERGVIKAIGILFLVLVILISLLTLFQLL